MTSEQIRTAALEWIARNTTFDVTLTPLPAGIELFIEKYAQVMELRAGVTSESIAGLSQSFSSGVTVSELLKQYARELIGEEYMLSGVKFFSYQDPWVKRR